MRVFSLKIFRVSVSTNKTWKTLNTCLFFQRLLKRSSISILLEMTKLDILGYITTLSVAWIILRKKSYRDQYSKICTSKKVLNNYVVVFFIFWYRKCKAAVIQIANCFEGILKGKFQGQIKIWNSFDSKKIKGYYKHLTGLFSAPLVKNVHQTTSKFIGIIGRWLYIGLQEK